MSNNIQIRQESNQCIIPEWRTELDKLHLKNWCDTVVTDYNTNSVSTGHLPALYGKNMMDEHLVVGNFTNDLKRSTNPSIEGFLSSPLYHDPNNYSTLSSCSSCKRPSRVFAGDQAFRPLKPTDLLGQQVRQPVKENFKSNDIFVTNKELCPSSVSSSYPTQSRTYLL